MLYEGVEFPIFCARDELVKATPGNAKSLDYIWVRGLQGSRFYHACAVRFMLK